MINKSKPGRNSLCHCGSGKKYKNCCFVSNEIQAPTRPQSLEFYGILFGAFGLACLYIIIFIGDVGSHEGRCALINSLRNGWILLPVSLVFILLAPMVIFGEGVKRGIMLSVKTVIGACLFFFGISIFIYLDNILRHSGC